jgi:hypothetical protein
MLRQKKESQLWLRFTRISVAEGGNGSTSEEDGAMVQVWPDGARTVREVVTASAFDRWSVELRAEYTSRIAADRSAASVGASFLIKLVESLPKRPCASIGNGVQAISGYFRRFALAATLAATPSAEAEPLRKAA